MRFAPAFAILLLFAAPVGAGEWIDDSGRPLSMQHPNSKPLYLTANGHSLADGIAAFGRLCIETGFDAEKAGNLAEQSDWGFSYREEIVPFKNPVDMGGYNSADAALRISDGIFFNKKAQCNFTFLPTLPAEFSDVEVGLTELLGSEPTNKNKKFKKNGEPRKYWSPEWAITNASGEKVVVFAKPSVKFANGFHLSILKN